MSFRKREWVSVWQTDREEEGDFYIIRYIMHVYAHIYTHIHRTFIQRNNRHNFSMKLYGNSGNLI